jgi:hypothetical protein
MSRITTASILHHRLSAVALAAILLMLLAACEDFYTDSLPTPDVAQPTPANVQVGDPAVILEETARALLATRLGVSPDAPRKILFEDETWTERNPGCYPAPDSITGAYLIPGFRLLMQYDGTFYEYDADQGAGTGALCNSTLQLVPVEPARNIVSTTESTESDLETIYVLRSEEDVAEFNSTQSDMASIAVDEIEWAEEVLVGGWVESSPDPLAVRAYLSEQGTSITIEVAISEDRADEASTSPSQIWALIDVTEPESTYEFIVIE